MKAFKKLVPTIKSRATPDDRPPEVTEAKRRYKEAAVDRQLLSRLLAVAADRTARAWESWQGVAEQLTHMSGDGRGEELAFLTNLADAQRQCADYLALLKDALGEQAVALQQIEKTSSASVTQAKQNFKKSEEALAKARKDFKKSEDAKRGADEWDDVAVSQLRTAMADSASELVETLESDRKGKTNQLASVLFSTFQAELSCAIETLEVLSSSRAAVERAAGVLGVQGRVLRGPVEIGLPTDVRHVGGGGVNLLESANRIDLNSAPQAQQLRARALEQAFPANPAARPSPIDAAAAAAAAAGSDRGLVTGAPAGRASAGASAKSEVAASAAAGCLSASDAQEPAPALQTIVTTRNDESVLSAAHARQGGGSVGTDATIRNAPVPPPPPAPPPELGLGGARGHDGGVSAAAARGPPGRPLRPPPAVPPPSTPAPPPPRPGVAAGGARAAGSAAPDGSKASQFENAQRLLHEARDYESADKAFSNDYESSSAAHTRDSVPLVFDSMLAANGPRGGVHAGSVPGAPPTPPPQWPPEGSLVSRLTQHAADHSNWDTDDVNSVDGEESECITGGESERLPGDCERADDEGATVEAQPRGTLAVAVAPSSLSGQSVVGWQAYYDNDGDIYFHNSETGVTQWERPEGFGGMPEDSVLASEQGSQLAGGGDDDEVVL